ncbi:TPA: hypothetical protein ENS27_04160 [bacterium]|nr:hypothetical protein [bacterium]
MKKFIMISIFISVSIPILLFPLCSFGFDVKKGGGHQKLSEAAIKTLKNDWSSKGLKFENMPLLYESYYNEFMRGVLSADGSPIEEKGLDHAYNPYFSMHGWESSLGDLRYEKYKYFKDNNIVLWTDAKVEFGKDINTT